MQLRFGRGLAFAAAAIAVLFSVAPYAGAAGVNMIQNGDLETASGSVPSGWIAGRWGDNSAKFEYPVAGDSGSGAKVVLETRNSGDAKWAHDFVSVEPGAVYSWSDRYISNVKTHVTVEFRTPSGQLSYLDIASPETASSFASANASFAVPAGVSGARVFHLINTPGYLITDSYVLEKREIAPPEEGNLIANASFGSVDSSGLPSQWTKGRWGVNETSFVFPAEGYGSAAGAEVRMISRQSGDAKWAFAPVSVSSGKEYEYKDRFKSDAATYLTAEFIRADGSAFYEDLAVLPASPSWSEASAKVVIPEGVVKARVFHLINSVGSLTISVPSMKGGDVPPSERAVISINFDDGRKDTFDRIMPFLNSRGVKSTQYVVTGRMFDGFPAFIKVPDILAAASAGHEIGAHSRTHTDLTAIGGETLQNETAGARQDLFDIGIARVDSFAYPFGAYNDSAMNAVRNAGFTSARSTDNGVNIPGSINAFALKRANMGINTTFEQAKAWIDDAVANKTWLILVFHEVDYSGTLYSVKPELFEKVIDYAKSVNADILTVSEGLKTMSGR